MHKEICIHPHSWLNFFRMRKDDELSKKVLDNFRKGKDSETLSSSVGGGPEEHY